MPVRATLKRWVPYLTVGVELTEGAIAPGNHDLSAEITSFEFRMLRPLSVAPLSWPRRYDAPPPRGFCRIASSRRSPSLSGLTVAPAVLGVTAGDDDAINLSASTNSSVDILADSRSKSFLASLWLY